MGIYAAGIFIHVKIAICAGYSLLYKCPSVGDFSNKPQYIHIIEYSAAVEKNEEAVFVPVQRDARV